MKFDWLESLIDCAAIFLCFGLPAAVIIIVVLLLL
jgi:hypothetical protein